MVYISKSVYFTFFSLDAILFLFFYILFNVVLQTMIILKTMKTIIVNVTIHVGCYCMCMLLWLMLFDREDTKVVWRHLVSVLHALSLLLNEIKGEESGHTSRPLMLQQEHTHCESTNCCRFPWTSPDNNHAQTLTASSFPSQRGTPSVFNIIFIMICS